MIKKIYYLFFILIFINCEKNTNELRDDYKTYKNDITRYIAHAGGKINTHTYTNSLEALNYNYSKGFRLFELDIIKTKDGKYVAAHDWEHWKKITGYKGITPVKQDVFLKQKIFNKYTALSISDLNEWFSKHEDAFLITDKVNSPIEFSKKFIAPNRLIMELFNWKAVKEGLSANILSAMPSQQVIENTPINEVNKLSLMGVKHVAISRRFISKNKEFLNELKINNIKVYAYHINFDKGKDEEYVVRNEMRYIHGIYADEWSFD